MKAYAPWLFLLALVGGCSARDQDDAIDRGAAITKRVVHSTVAVAGSVWDKASEEARKLTPESGRKALEDAKASLEDAEGKLQPGKRLDEAKAQVARIRAALDIDLIRHEMHEKLKQVQDVKDRADQSVGDAKRKVDELDADYRDLKAKLASAQETYDRAVEKVDSLKQSIGG